MDTIDKGNFNKIIEISKILEEKREKLKESNPKDWSYRGFAKQAGINHRHISRVLNPKEFYTFLTLLDVIYNLGFYITINDDKYSSLNISFDSLEDFKSSTLEVISSLIKEKMLENEYSQRGLGIASGLAHTQVKGVLNGSKNYNVETLIKILNVFGLDLKLKEYGVWSTNVS